MKILPNKNNVYLTLSIITMMVIIIFFVTFFTTHNKYDQQGTNIKNFKTISFLKPTNNNNLFEQTFSSKNNFLDNILFYFRNTGSTNKLELSILDNTTNEIIRNEKFIIKDEDHIQILNWDFENISDSKNKEFSLLILAEKNNLELVTAPADRYQTGVFLFNGVKSQDSILAFSFEYYSDNLFSVLQKRLAIYKPGIFNNVWGFNILFVIIFCLVWYTVYIVSKSIIKKD